MKDDIVVTFNKPPSIRQKPVRPNTEAPLIDNSRASLGFRPFAKS